MNNFLEDRLKRLRKEYCWICGKEMKAFIHGEGVSWICKECNTKATDFLPDILGLGLCGQCGDKIKLSSVLLEEQKNGIEKGFNNFVCDKCLNKNHMITDEELKNIRIDK